MQKNIIRIDMANEDIYSNMDDDCYVLSTMVDKDFLEKFIKKANEQEKIVLFYGEGSVTFAKKYNADGVIMDMGAEDLDKRVPMLRKELGKDKFVGLFTRNRRHEAMLVSEAEPDFIIFKVWKDGFETVKELTDWYVEFFLIQSASWLMEEGIEGADTLNTDFIVK